MRIGIECSTLTRNIAGIGNYTYQLVKGLARQDGPERYTLFYNRPLPPLSIPSRMRHSLQGPASTHLWAQTRLLRLCEKEKVDVLHSPGQGLPLLYTGKTVLTVHDVSPLLFPEQKEWQSRIIWNCVVPIMARQADHLITPSEHTRTDVIERLGIAESKVTRIYEAAGDEYYPELDQERIEAFKKKKALQPGYILAVATLEPRKNFPFLFEVFKAWLERSQSEATLVVVGKHGWLYDEIFEAYERLNLRKHVRFEGYVQDMDLMRLYYSAAEFSILSPFYEGFWLPGLESLACGTPVIAPRHSSIPEVVGDAGLLIDSWDQDEWLVAMDRFWKASDREIWSQRGIAQTKKFSWDAAAKETLAVYRQVGEKTV